MRVTSGVTLLRATRTRRTRPAFTAVVAGTLGATPAKSSTSRGGAASGTCTAEATSLPSPSSVISTSPSSRVARRAVSVRAASVSAGAWLAWLRGHVGGHASGRVDHQALSILDLLLDLAGLPEQSRRERPRGRADGEDCREGREDRRARAHHRFSSVVLRGLRISRCFTGDSGSSTRCRKITASLATTLTVPS